MSARFVRQIMDTPGVLSRPDEDRNEMEALTLASMQHLPTAVVFVMDLSGLSGSQSSLENQVWKTFGCPISYLRKSPVKIEIEYSVLQGRLGTLAR